LLTAFQSRYAPTNSRAQFTAKQLNRQAAKAGKDEQTEKAKLKKVFLPYTHTHRNKRHRIARD